MRIPYFRVMLAASATIAFMLFLAGCDKGQPHEHTYGDWSVENATCTEDGKKTRTCECGETETEAIPATGHDSGKWIVQSQATCTEDGSEHLVCTVCQATLSTLTTPAAHTPSSDWITDSDATCTTTGSKHLECTTCHETLKTESIRAKGHVTNADWITDIEVTCTEKGSRHLECPVCNGTLKTEAIPAKGHTINDEWIIDLEATCTEGGIKHQECSTCHDQLTSEEIEATGHTFGEWIVVQEATCDIEGIKERECACSAKESENFSTDHTGEYISANETNNQIVATWHCPICNVDYCKEVTPVTASCKVNSLYMGSPNTIIWSLDISGGIGDYTYNVYMYEQEHVSSSNYNLVEIWTNQTNPIFAYNKYDTFEMNNLGVQFVIEISDSIGIVTYRYLFENYIYTFPLYSFVTEEYALK